MFASQTLRKMYSKAEQLTGRDQEIADKHKKRIVEL